ncbi:MAG: PorP/SprF family type IX secretion system membrane protein [Chitinophagales bacterium]
MRNALRFILLFSLITNLTLVKSFGQIQTLSSHYHLNQLSINPGAAGSDGGVNIFLNYRGQWVGLTGSPNTQTLAADMSLPMINSGAGITVTNDMVGAERHTAVRANFAYFLDINKEYKIGFGLGAGIINMSVDGSKLVTPQGDDDFLPSVKTSATRPDIALGTYIKSKQLRAGISYNSLLRKASIDGDVNTLETKYGSYLNLFGAYEIIFNEKFSLEPSMQVRTDFKNYQTDIGALFSYNNFIFTGVFIRGYNKLSIDAFYGTVGFKPIGSLSVFYSYDMGLNTLNDVHNGSHEISINVSIPEQKLFKRGKIIYNPRYL